MKRECDNCKYRDVYYMAPPCDECNFEYQRQPQKGFQNWESNAMTNADRIRLMTDDELSIFIEGAICPTPFNGSWCRRDSERWNCKDCWINWLKEEVKDE